MSTAYMSGCEQHLHGWVRGWRITINDHQTSCKSRFSPYRNLRRTLKNESAGLFASRVKNPAVLLFALSILTMLFPVPVLWLENNNKATKTAIET